MASTRSSSCWYWSVVRLSRRADPFHHRASISRWPDRRTRPGARRPSPFQLPDGLAPGQVELRSRAREVQELAAEDQRRAGRPHVHLAGAAVIQPPDGVLELRAADDGILAEQDPLALDQLLDGDQLHAGHQVAHALVRGHEAARPGRRVFDVGAARTGRRPYWRSRWRAPRPSRECRPHNPPSWCRSWRAPRRSGSAERAVSVESRFWIRAGVRDARWT